MMKAIFKIHLNDSVEVTGEQLRKAVEAISKYEDFYSGDYKCELYLSNDDGDFYVLGLNSGYSERDSVIVTLPDENPEINFEKKYKDGDIAVRSWEFYGMKYAVNVLPVDIKKATHWFKQKLEELLNS